MSLSSLELWRRIEAEGIATPEQCRTWAGESAQSLSPNEVTSGLKVLQRLVELKRLTNYQAKILAGQSNHPLRLGSHGVVGRLRDTIWNGWYELKNDGRWKLPQRVWGRCLSQDELLQLRSAAPSIHRARSIAETGSDHLQASAPPEVADSGLLVVLAPAVGDLIIDKFTSSGCSPSLALGIVRQVAVSLAALHEKGCVHGRVLPDRVSLTPNHQATLLIDPLCAATATAESTSVGLLGHNLGGAITAQFIAPEFLAPGQQPTPATDVFSLGCLWWWLLTGRPPVSATVAEQALVEHSQTLPNLPTECRLPELQLRCLQHALARRPTARFPTATNFLAALEAALRLQPQLVKSKRVVEPGATEQPAAKLAATVVPARSPLPVAETVATQPSVAPPATLPALSRRRRKASPPWLIPVLSGCGVLIVLLLALRLSGVLQPEPTASGPKPAPAYVPHSGVGETPQRAADPRESSFQIVASDTGALWVPPALPQPVAVDLLPPGGQIFLSLRPTKLQAALQAQLANAFDPQLTDLLDHIRERAGVALESLEQVTVAFYPPQVGGGYPQYCLRCTLSKSVSLSDLKKLWTNVVAQSVGEQAILVGANELAYYVAHQPLVDSQAITAFSVGPIEIMRDVPDLRGARGPMLTQMEKLWNASDRQADLAMFGMPAFLFTEGRALLADAPLRLTDELQELLGNDMRGLGIQMRLEPNWYLETRLIGANDQDAGRILAKQQALVRGLPTAIEQWLVSRPAHPYWRAIALRFPQMMRAFADYSRFGVENGVALMNTYLPTEAAGNLLLASWIGLQVDSTGEASANQEPPTELPTQKFTVEDYLARPIRLSFDQEPLEVALRLVSEEANDRLPSGSTPALRFSLDGDAFEKAGITRNQPLRDFKIDNLPVRAALTEIVKRGNPVTTVKDTHEPDQRLIWVVTPDPDSPNVPMISLTTRAAADAAGIELPSEFKLPSL